MKEYYMEKLNQMRDEEALKSLEQTSDDTDWNAPTFDSAGYTEADRMADDEQNPIEVDPKSGKKLYLIKQYKIWAYNYKQALELLPMIEGF